MHQIGHLFSDSSGLGWGHVVQINISQGGVPKFPVNRAEVTRQGIVGDRQRQLHVHGGPDRALCLWSLEVIQVLQRDGHPIQPGSAGENITVAGLDWPAVISGVRLQLGPDVQIQITDYAPPCRQIMQCFADRRFSRINHTHFPGSSRVYARVVTPGVVASGDSVFGL